MGQKWVDRTQTPTRVFRGPGASRVKRVNFGQLTGEPRDRELQVPVVYPHDPPPDMSIRRGVPDLASLPLLGRRHKQSTNSTAAFASAAVHRDFHVRSQHSQLCRCHRWPMLTMENSVFKGKVSEAFLTSVPSS
jgi:hypothetical protein